MAAGANDHPSAVTAMQVYKILSLTQTFMPPPSKYANCSSDKNKLRIPSVISLKDITNIYKKKSDKLTAFPLMMKTLDKIVKTDELDVFDVLAEHNYDTKFENESILYFTAAKICKKLCDNESIKHCSVCNNALLAPRDDPSLKAEEHGLEEWELEFQPKPGFHQLIVKLDNIFKSHEKKLNVAELVFSEAADKNLLVFPCEQHKIKVMEFTLEFFISMKMIKIASDVKKKKEKQSMHHKKISHHKDT